MSPERARRILNQHAGHDKYSLREAARLTEGLHVLLRAVHSVPRHVRHLHPPRPDEI